MKISLSFNHRVTEASSGRVITRREYLVSKKNHRTYGAHETSRMLQLHGTRLASFKSRAAAFGVDFVLVFWVFYFLLISGVWLAPRIGMVLKEDIHLSFDFTHWYSLVFLVVYFTLWTYWTNGRSAGKWLFGIRVVSLVHERVTLWSSFERSLGYGASFLEFGFGFLQYFIHPNRSAQKLFFT